MTQGGEECILAAVGRPQRFSESLRLVMSMVADPAPNLALIVEKGGGKAVDRHPAAVIEDEFLFNSVKRRPVRTTVCIGSSSAGSSVRS